VQERHDVVRLVLHTAAFTAVASAIESGREWSPKLART
jgi:hypothetical protein